MKRNFVLFIAFVTIASASAIATTDSPGPDNGYPHSQTESIPLSNSTSGNNSTLVTESTHTPQSTRIRDEGELETLFGWMPSIESVPTVDSSQFGKVSSTGTGETISSVGPTIAESVTLSRSLSAESSSSVGSTRCSGSSSTTYDTAGYSVGDDARGGESTTEKGNGPDMRSTYSTAISSTSSDNSPFPTNGTIEETPVQTSSQTRLASDFAPDKVTETPNSPSAKTDNSLEMGMVSSGKNCSEDSGTKPSQTIGESCSPKVGPTIDEHEEDGAGTEWKATLSTSNKPPSSTRASGNFDKDIRSDPTYYGLEEKGDSKQEHDRANEQKENGYVSAYLVAEIFHSPILSIAHPTIPNSPNSMLTVTSTTPMNPLSTTILTTHSTAMAPSNGTHGNINIGSMTNISSSTVISTTLSKMLLATPSPEVSTNANLSYGSHINSTSSNPEAGNTSSRTPSRTLATLSTAAFSMPLPAPPETTVSRSTTTGAISETATTPSTAQEAAPNATTNSTSSTGTQSPQASHLTPSPSQPPNPSTNTDTDTKEPPSPSTQTSTALPTALTLLYTYPHPTLRCIPLSLPPNSTLQTRGLTQRHCTLRIFTAEEMELGVCAAAGDGDGDGRVGGGVGVFEGVRDGVVYDVPLGMGALTVECSL